MRKLIAHMLWMVATTSAAYGQAQYDARCASASSKLVPSQFEGVMPDVAMLSDSDFLARMTEMTSTVDAISRKAHRLGPRQIN